MKNIKILSLSLALVLAFSAIPLSAKVPAEQVKDSGVASLLARNREMEGLQMRSLGKTWIKFLGKLAGAGSEDPDVERILSGVGGINRILVVDFSGCSEKDREEFTNDLEALISRSEKMFEGKDKGESLGIYGLQDPEEGKVRDLVIRPKGGKTVIFAIGSATSSLLSAIMSAESI